MPVAIPLMKITRLTSFIKKIPLSSIVYWSNTVTKYFHQYSVDFIKNLTKC